MDSKMGENSGSERWIALNKKIKIKLLKVMIYKEKVAIINIKIKYNI